MSDLWVCNFVIPALLTHTIDKELAGHCAEADFDRLSGTRDGDTVCHSLGARRDALRETGSPKIADIWGDS